MKKTLALVILVMTSITAFGQRPGQVIVNDHIVLNKADIGMTTGQSSNQRSGPGADVIQSLPDGTPIPNSWNYPDVIDTMQSLAAYSGKTIYLEVIQAWMIQCQNYHASGALETFYQQHGPTATGDSTGMVFLIECNPGNDVAQLISVYSPSISYPMIDLDTGATNFANWWQVSFYPNILKICPDGRVYQMGLPNAAQLAAAVGTCPFNLDATTASCPAFYCGSTFGLQFGLKNNCISSALTSCMIDYSIDGSMPISYPWGGNLNAGLTTTITLPSQTYTPGTHTLTVITSLPNGGTDENIVNDSMTYIFNVEPTATMAPYQQTFGSSSFPSGYPGWILRNPDNDVTMAYDTVAGGSLFEDTWNYPVIGEVDEVIMEGIDLSTMSVGTAFRFDVAHCEYNTVTSDQLQVFISTTCGTSWTQVYSKAGSVLATVSPNIAQFVPAANQWRTETISLTPYIGMTDVRIKFVITNGYGNGVYIKNIDISTSTAVTETVDESGPMKVFPNPADDNTTVMLSLTATADVTINVTSITGALVATKPLGTMTEGEHAVAIETSNLEAGMYMIEVVSDGLRRSTRMIVEH